MFKETPGVLKTSRIPSPIRQHHHSDRLYEELDERLCGFSCGGNDDNNGWQRGLLLQRQRQRPFGELLNNGQILAKVV